MKFDNTNAGGPEVALDQGSSPKRPKLKLERQVIRTLTGDELQLIGGGVCIPVSVGATCGVCTNQTNATACGVTNATNCSASRMACVTTH
jgi:hypothetical protein